MVIPEQSNANISFCFIEKSKFWFRISWAIDIVWFFVTSFVNYFLKVFPSESFLNRFRHALPLIRKRWWWAITISWICMWAFSHLHFNFFCTGSFELLFNKPFECRDRLSLKSVWWLLNDAHLDWRSDFTDVLSTSVRLIYHHDRCVGSLWLWSIVNFRSKNREIHSIFRWICLMQSTKSPCHLRWSNWQRLTAGCCLRHQIHSSRIQGEKTHLLIMNRGA